MKRIFAIALCFLLLPGICLAHKVIVFAWVEQGQVHVEGSFGSKRMARNSAVTALDNQGRVVNQGRTNSKGGYTFPLPEVAGDLLIRLDAGTGHQATWTVPEAELKAADIKKAPNAAMEKKAALEKGPSWIRIALGIGIIFILAFVTARFKAKRDHSND